MSGLNIGFACVLCHDECWCCRGLIGPGGVVQEAPLVIRWVSGGMAMWEIEVYYSKKKVSDGRATQKSFYAFLVFRNKISIARRHFSVRNTANQQATGLITKLNRKIVILVLNEIFTVIYLDTIIVCIIVLIKVGKTSKTFCSVYFETCYNNSYVYKFKHKIFNLVTNITNLQNINKKYLFHKKNK